MQALCGKTGRSKMKRTAFLKNQNVQNFVQFLTLLPIIVNN